jgi:hypothetical protein
MSKLGEKIKDVVISLVEEESGVKFSEFSQIEREIVYGLTHQFLEGSIVKPLIKDCIKQFVLERTDTTFCDEWWLDFIEENANADD